MIKLLTFDLDNTLWHTDPVIIRAETEGLQWLFEQAPEVAERFSTEQIRRKRIDLIRQEPELVHFISRWRIRSLELLLQECGYDRDTAADLAQRSFDVFQHHREDIVLFDGVEEAMAELAGDFTLVALTNGNANVFNTDAGRHFDHAIRAEEIGAAKPAPDMFLAALGYAGVAPHQSIHIGDDFKNDHEPAAALGMHTLQAALLGEDNWRDENSPPVFRDWRELPALIRSIARVDEP